MGLHRHAFCLLLLFGCSSETSPLKPGDLDASTVPDAADVFDGGNIGPDAGGRDAGPRDAGGRDAGTIGGECPPAMSHVSFEFSANVQAYDGPAQIMSLSPFIFQPRGSSSSIQIDWAQPRELRIAPQSMHAWVKLEVHQPFWQELRLSVYDLDEQGQRGPLLFAAWEGSRWSEGDLGEIKYGYEANGCSFAPESKCGSSIGLDMIADVGATVLFVPHGSLVRTDDGFVVYGGTSSRFTTAPLCPDTPSAWYQGYVYAESFPALPCSRLRPDTCISVAGCVLYGEENIGAGYSCVPAVGECEVRPGLDACGQRPGCLWTSGGCYCPENEICACGGGPPPRCQSLCQDDPASCPSSASSQRYCAPATTNPPACMPNQEPAVCDWQPTDCSAAEGITLCACTTAGLRTFNNDCLRRQAGAGVYTSGACN